MLDIHATPIQCTKKWKKKRKQKNVKTKKECNKKQTTKKRLKCIQNETNKKELELATARISICLTAIGYGKVVSGF